MVLFRSMDYTVGASDSYLFGVSYGGVKGGVVPSTTTLPSKKLIVGLIVKILCYQGVNHIHQ